MENVLKTTKADEKALLEAESRYCSYGDTVHYLEPAKLFAGCNGSFLYDYEDKPYLDLQMWYSAVNFGYANPRLKKVLDERKIMLVDDEIQMGFYRTGKLWGLQNFGITPDVVVFGKAMTNGLNPLAGIWAKERYINPQVFPCGSTHSTFASNPLGTAVALETMRMLAEEDYETRVREMGAYFLEGLRELKSRYAIIGDVDGLGLALRAEICAADGFTPDKAMMDRIVDEGIKGDLMVDGKRYGLVLDVGGYYKNVITLAPSLNITREEVDLAMRLLDEILRRVTKN